MSQVIRSDDSMSCVSPSPCTCRALKKAKIRTANLLASLKPLQDTWGGHGEAQRAALAIRDGLRDVIRDRGGCECEICVNTPELEGGGRREDKEESTIVASRGASQTPPHDPMVVEATRLSFDGCDRSCDFRSSEGSNGGLWGGSQRRSSLTHSSKENDGDDDDDDCKGFGASPCVPETCDAFLSSGDPFQSLLTAFREGGEQGNSTHDYTVCLSSPNRPREAR